MNKYVSYAQSVVDGEVVTCELIKLACKRYLDWFDKYDFRPDKVDKVVNFISKLKHFTGKHNGKKFELQPYQLWIIANIFGFYHKGTEERVIKYCYIELARKSGKTALAAAIALYMLVADGENGSEVEMVANSRQQAKICFDMASNFLQTIDKKGKYFKRYRDKIKFDHTKSFLQVLSSDSSTNDGYNSYCFILDECHAQPDSRLWDVMVSSQGMRENSLGIIITTAGLNKFGFCYGYRQTCVDVLYGLKENDSQFTAIYTLDEEDDWTDPENWIKANPSLGITVSKSYLQQQVQNAKNNTSLEVGTRTKNFNQWVNSSDVWISQEDILKSTEDFDFDKFTGEEVVYVGVDLAAVSDLTAVAYMIPFGDKFYFKTHYYIPQSCLHENSNKELYKDWVRKGFITATEGNVCDYDYLLKDLLKTNSKLYIEKIGYDSYNATQWAINATAAGLPLEPFSQALWSFNRPTKEFERLLKSGKIVLDNNEVTRWCFSNVGIKSDHNDNLKPVKVSDQQKIDGTIAIVEALGTYLNQPQYSNEIVAL